eukprot:scaffold96084_cov17-Prasinocladus_malaysianus.AAC.1
MESSLPPNSPFEAGQRTRALGYLSGRVRSRNVEDRPTGIGGGGINEELSSSWLCLLGPWSGKQGLEPQ